MSAPKPAVRPRLSGGGFNQGFGEVNEHMDEQAQQQAAAQKSLSQQGTSQATSPGAQAQQAAGQHSQASQTPREVTPRKELPWFMQDLAEGLASFFDVNAVFQIDPAKDSPEEQAQKQQMHQRYQQLSQEEKNYVQQKYKMDLQKKQQQEQEEQQKKQQQQQESQQLSVPSSPQKGPVGPGSQNKKKGAIDKMQQERKTLGSPAGMN